MDRLIRGTEDGDIGNLAELDIVKVAMKPYFIPETTTLDEQMREFLKRRTHFALVVDEYGALQGSSRWKTSSRKSSAKSPTNSTWSPRTVP